MNDIQLEELNTLLQEYQKYARDSLLSPHCEALANQLIDELEHELHTDCCG